MRVTCLHGGWLASLPEALRDELITALTPAQARALLYEWLFWARPNQLPPDGNWRVWLLLAGRGFGKTRTGAEMIRARGGTNGAPVRACGTHSRRCARCHGGRRQRHPGDIASVGAASLRAIEATTDPAKRSYRYIV